MAPTQSRDVTTSEAPTLSGWVLMLVTRSRYPNRVTKQQRISRFEGAHARCVMSTHEHCRWQDNSACGSAREALQTGTLAIHCSNRSITASIHSHGTSLGAWRHGPHRQTSNSCAGTATASRATAHRNTWWHGSRRLWASTRYGGPGGVREGKDCVARGCPSRVRSPS